MPSECVLIHDAYNVILEYLNLYMYNSIGNRIGKLLLWL